MYKKNIIKLNIQIYRKIKSIILKCKMKITKENYNFFKHGYITLKHQLIKIFYSLYEYESDDSRKKSEIYRLDDLYYKLREVVEFILLEKKNAKRDKSLVILGKKINQKASRV